MSEILVNTIKKADGTGSLTVPAETGTVVTTAGANFTGDVEVYQAGTSEVLVGSDNGGTAQLSFYENNSSTKEFVVKYDGLNNRGVIETSGKANAVTIKRDNGHVLIEPSSGFESRESCQFQVNNRSAGQSAAVINSENSTDYNAFAFYRASASASGSIRVGGSSVSYNTSSDYRLKENVVDMTGAITRVKSLSPKRFNFIADTDDTTVDGFLAHETQTVVPEAVSGTQDGVKVWKEGEDLPDGVSVGDNKLDGEGNTIPDYQGIDQSKLVPLLTGALQEAIAKIETLETTVADLQTRVTALEGA